MAGASTMRIIAKAMIMASQWNHIKLKPAMEVQLMYSAGGVRSNAGIYDERKHDTGA